MDILVSSQGSYANDFSVKKTTVAEANAKLYHNATILGIFPLESNSGGGETAFLINNDLSTVVGFRPADHGSRMHFLHHNHFFDVIY